MKRFLFLTALLWASTAQALPEYGMTATSVTAAASVSASYVEKLSSKKFLAIDVVNNSDCIVQIRLDDASGAPDSYIPASSAEIIEFGKYGGQVETAISLKKASGETCSSGNVYIKGIHK